ncbi:unnamed protein product [Haemonchus placei]|uniref:TNFR-Cys domain-containing protein n=1 Tax=Haemonchus placei TaxID=6290 RepID=A0A158QLI5_HAEPC|nr:unnamed protein product [Haemonchus placei]
MKMLILAALIITITINVNVNGAKVDNVFTECSENEYYDEETETCEPCTECKNSHYERQACTVFRDRIIDVDEHSDRRRLPPLPTDEYDDDEYADEEDVKYEVPSSEEELQGVDIIGSVVVNPIDDQYDEEVVKKPKKHDFAPISGDEFLRSDDASGEDDEDDKELEEGDVKPLEVDEEKIGQDDDLEDSGELLEGTGGHVNIVAIAIRNKKTLLLVIVSDYNTHQILIDLLVTRYLSVIEKQMIQSAGRNILVYKVDLEEILYSMRQQLSQEGSQAHVHEAGKQLAGRGPIDSVKKKQEFVTIQSDSKKGIDVHD